MEGPDRVGGPALRGAVTGLGGPVWGVAVMLMLAVLLVLNVVRLKRSSTGPLPVRAMVVAVVVVLAGIGLLLAFGST